METADQRWARYPNDEDANFGAKYSAAPDTVEELLTKAAQQSILAPRYELENAQPRTAPVGRHRVLGVLDALGSGRNYADAAQDYSGSPAGFTGSLRYSMGGW